MTDSSTAERYYRESQEAICDLITVENEHQPVPACPGWSLRDVLAHLAGAMQDFVSGNTEGAPGPEWTSGHVERFRDADIVAIKTAWSDALVHADPVFQQMGEQLLPDIVTHEFDVRGTLENTDARDSNRLAAAVDVMLTWGHTHYENAGIPAIDLRIDGKSWILGQGSPQAVVSTDIFRISRVLTGRRSEAQIRALDWSVDPSPWIDHMSMLGKRNDDLIE